MRLYPSQEKLLPSSHTAPPLAYDPPRPDHHCRWPTSPRGAGTSGAAPASPAFSSPDIEAAVKLAIGPAVHAAVQATLAAMAAAGGAGEGAGGAAAPAAASPEALAEALKPVVEALQVSTVKRAQGVLNGCRHAAAAAVCVGSPSLCAPAGSMHPVPLQCAACGLPSLSLLLTASDPKRSTGLACPPCPIRRR